MRADEGQMPNDRPIFSDPPLPTYPSDPMGSLGDAIDAHERGASYCDTNKTLREPKVERCGV